MTFEILFAFVAIFFAVKAVEYDARVPSLAAICSIGAWICAGVAVILVVVRS